MATCAASTPRAGTCRCRRSPTAPRRSGGWCAASTLTAPTGSRRPTPAATSASATIPPGPPGLTMRWRPSAPPPGCSGCPSPCTPAPREACKQAIRCGARSLEHAYLIDEEGDRHGGAGRRVHRADDADDPGGPRRAASRARFPARRSGSSAATTSRSSTPSGWWPSSDAKVAYGTDCGMFPFSHGIREFQAMVNAGLTPIRALTGRHLGRRRAARPATTSACSSPARCADIVAMPGEPARRHRRHRPGRLRHARRRRVSPTRR